MVSQHTQDAFKMENCISE